MAIEVFSRKETKYLLNENEYNLLMNKISYHLEKDKYFQSTICNIYFDTDNYDLIINSIDKPMYKEKVRLRSYNIPSKNDIVFLEVKKKYKGIVSKRRIEIKLSDFYNYYNKNIINNSSQIMKEIDYLFKLYRLKPKLYLAYDRLSYYDKDNPNFRITFDTNIRSRDDNLKLDSNDDGQLYFNEKMYIMETKTLNSLPLWFVKILNELKLYPKSFSKYGSIYTKKIKEEYYV